jgi:LysR family hydrogen peroxide-inducible transcriptional activator
LERNQLRYVIEVAKYENITHAAKALHISQPSLSSQILNLEQEFGISLFERSRKRVYLTEAGKNFIYQATQILNDMEQLEKAMKDFAACRKGSIQIGVLPIMVSLGITDIITSFRERYQAIDVTLMELGSSALYQRVSLGEIDAAFVILDNDFSDEEMHMVKLMESRLVAAVNTANPLSKQKELSMESLRNQHIIITSTDFSLPHFYLTPLAKQNIPYKISGICTQVESCFALVEKNFGITFCSEETSKHYVYEHVVYIPVLGIGTRSIYLIYKKNLQNHPALQAFIEFIQKHYEIQSTK